RSENLRARELHSGVLEELSASFDSEIEPLVVEIAGVQHRLTGTAALQHAELRALLRRLYREEAGLLSEEPDAPAEPGSLRWPDGFETVRWQQAELETLRWQQGLDTVP